MNYQGSCHCGAVKFSFDVPEITGALRCNCSICTRKGGLMSDFVLSREDLNIEAADSALCLYQFGNKVAKHYFCSTCGIYPFHETFRQPGYHRVNLNCISGLDQNQLEVTLFDGRSL